MQSHANRIPGSATGDSVGGELVGGTGRATTTFAAGRVCDEEGCDTRLSKYNSRTRCAVHDFDPSLMNFRCPAPAPSSADGSTTRRAVTSARSAKRRPPAERPRAA